MNKEIIKTIIVGIIMCAVLLPIMFYLYPRSALGNPLCDQMSEQGYYETEWDTAGHTSCINNYKKGIDECNGLQKFMRVDPDDCYSGELNMTCLEERSKIDSQLSEYGFHCVWGGAGYWIFVLMMAIPFILIMPLVMIITIIYSEYKKKKPKHLNTRETLNE